MINIPYSKGMWKEVVGFIVWLVEKKLAAIWSEFEAIFYHQFLAEAIKAMRRLKFAQLHQGDLIVIEYGQNFTALAAFVPRIVVI